MYGKKKMQKGGKISKGKREDYTSMPEMDMKEVINSANRTSKMDAEADKKLMEVLSDKKKKTVKPKSKSKSKSKVINVSPGKPYYSSKELGEGYEERLPSAVYSADLRKRSPFGKASPKAAGLDVVAEFQNLSRGKEGKTGSSLAKKTAKELVKKNAGGKVSSRYKCSHNRLY